MLSLCLYIKDDKKQVSWLDSTSESVKNISSKSFSIIRVRLENNIIDINQKKIEYYLEVLGLKTYITKPFNDISVECMGNRREIPKLYKSEWFLELPNGIKLYKAKWLDLEELSEEEKKLKNMLANNTIFFNDMLNAVEFETKIFQQLKGVEIPFIMLDVKNVNDVEVEVKTDLSRSRTQISGNIMKIIAKGIYKLEVEKMLYVLKDIVEENKKGNCEINSFDIVRQMKNSCMIIKNNIDILLHENKLLFCGKNQMKHIEIWGDEIIKGNIICISSDYLDNYIYKSTSPQNGLRKEALVKILNHIGIKDVCSNNSSLEIWNYIKNNKKFIKNTYTEKAINNIIWVNEDFKQDIEIKAGYLVVFNSSVVENYLDNQFIYYNVDRIHTAISKNSKITFQYFQWNVRKEMELRNEGALYEVSPWALSCNNENYYLIAYDGIKKEIRHFRVDKMRHIEITNAKREGRAAVRGADMAIYEKKIFGMFGGKEENVKIECIDSLAGVIIDRFGKEVSLIKSDKEHFTVNVRVAVSRQFLGWIIALGEGARIVSPESVVHQINEEIERLIRQYRV